MSETGNLTAGRRAAGLGSGDGGIAAAELTRRGRELLATAKRVMIPYVAGGGNLGGMDCQGLIEYLMALCGLRRDWKGSNDMWRNALKWAGTPEAFCERFGAMTGGGKEGDALLPAGAAVFIVENDGGEPDEYKRTDEARFGGGKGNASHVGLYLGGGSVIHASASMGKVCESTKFDGRNAVGNGGWNLVGLWADVDYGAELEAALAAYGDVGENAEAASGGADSLGNPDSIVCGDNSIPPASLWSPRYSHITVKLGCLGGAVREVQRGLRLLGVSIEADGEFGPITDAEVRRFQRRHGLAEDGVVGARTWAALKRAVMEA